MFVAREQGRGFGCRFSRKCDFPLDCRVALGWMGGGTLPPFEMRVRTWGVIERRGVEPFCGTTIFLRKGGRVPAGTH